MIKRLNVGDIVRLASGTKAEVMQIVGTVVTVRWTFIMAAYGTPGSGPDWLGRKVGDETEYSLKIVERMREMEIEALMKAFS